MKQHPTYKEIWVTEDGKVFRELTPSLDSAGYHQIRNGDFRQRRHTLICEAFHGPRPPGMVVRHKDGNPANDHPDNLEWGTQYQNTHDDTIRHGRTTRGAKNRHNKLAVEQVREIRLRRKAGEKGSVLAIEFGITQQTVYDIVTGRCWGWLEDS